MSSRTSVTSVSYGRRANYYDARRQLARQAVVQSRRQAVATLPIDISRATLNRLSGASVMPHRSGEMKQVDVNLTTITLNATQSSLTLLNGVAPGTAKYQRIGNKIQPSFIDLQMQVINLATSSNLSFKYAIIYDRQPTGTLPTYSDIYQNVNAAGTTSTTILSGRNMDTTDRFVTIAADDLWLPYPSAASGGLQLRLIRCLRSLRGYVQQFKGLDALLGSISTGAIYLLVASNTTAGENISVNFDCRYKYTDM